MDLNGDEKRIRQLFREMSRDELRQAPEFALVVAATRSATLRSRNRYRSLRFVFAISVVFLVLLAAVAIIRKPSPRQAAEAPPLQASASNSPEEPNSITRPRPVDARGPVRKRVATRHHKPRNADQLTIAMKSLFAWRSPTASLLNTPVDELLRSLPRLGESLQTIKPYSPDEFNLDGGR